MTYTFRNIPFGDRMKQLDAMMGLLYDSRVHDRDLVNSINVLRLAVESLAAASTETKSLLPDDEGWRSAYDAGAPPKVSTLPPLVPVRTPRIRQWLQAMNIDFNKPVTLVFEDCVDKPGSDPDGQQVAR